MDAGHAWTSDWGTQALFRNGTNLISTRLSSAAAMRRSIGRE
jgi:hypothetical protein